MPRQKTKQECVDPSFRLKIPRSTNRYLSHRSKRIYAEPPSQEFYRAPEELFAGPGSVFQMVPLSATQQRTMRRPGLRPVLTDGDHRMSRPVLLQRLSIGLALLLHSVINPAKSKS